MQPVQAWLLLQVWGAVELAEEKTKQIAGLLFQARTSAFPSECSAVANVVDACIVPSMTIFAEHIRCKGMSTQSAIATFMTCHSAFFWRELQQMQWVAIVLPQA